MPPQQKMNWDKLQEIDDLDGQFPSEAGYVDNEVDEALTEEDAPTITVDATFVLDPAITGGVRSEGRELPHSRRYVWRNPEGLRLDYFIDPEEGYFIAFGSEQVEKILGCIGSHPFVCTKKFSFGNFDGSTWCEDTNLIDPTPEQVAELFNRKSPEYLFNQVH